MYLEDLLNDLSIKLDAIEGHQINHRSGSRYVGTAADASYVARVANGEEIRVAPPPFSAKQSAGGGRGGVAYAMKALAEGTGSSGGYLVPVEVASEVLRMLRARSAVLRMGPRVVQVKKELDVTAISSGATAGYVGENALIPVSEQTFSQSVLLRPRALASLVPVSTRLLRDAADSPDVERVIREDLAEVLALRADLAFLRGAGNANEPLGIANNPNLTPAPNAPAGGFPDFDFLKDIVASLRERNAPFNRPGWIFHPSILSTLEKLKDTSGHYLADTGLLTFDATGGGGTLLSFPFRTTTQLPTNLQVGSEDDGTELIFSSDWSECWIGENDELRIELSSEASYTTDGGTTWMSAFQAQQVLFRSTWNHDLGLRRPQLFVVATVRA